jgi:hypothetical protein
LFWAIGGWQAITDKFIKKQCIFEIFSMLLKSRKKFGGFEGLFTSRWKDNGCPGSEQGQDKSVEVADVVWRFFVI